MTSCRSDEGGQDAKAAGFPIILHATMDMPDYALYGGELLRLLDFFGHKEVIVHPICKKEPVTGQTVRALARELEALHASLERRGIRLYVENNSRLDGFFETVDDLRVVFDPNPDIGLLLDLAHTRDYRHLREIVDMRFPACLHFADKRFGVPHEHLELGKGDLNFPMIFRDILAGYSGRLILEAADSNESIMASKLALDALLKHQNSTKTAVTPHLSLATTAETDYNRLHKRKKKEIEGFK